MQAKDRAAVEFSLCWESKQATHRDRLYVENVDFWRDVIPADLERGLQPLQEGERCRIEFEAGVLVPPVAQKDLRSFAEVYFDSENSGQSLVPRVGRFYPQGIAHQGLGCFKQNLNPFRVVSLAEGMVSADMNHPLASYPLTIEAEIISKKVSGVERGGSCHDIAELVTIDGPGMQAAYPEAATDFYQEYPFARNNEADDGLFYQQPRLVNHLDSQAIAHISQLYGRLLQPGTDILDLMSSWVSHLPPALEKCRVTGVGMNQEELDANRLLDQRLVHDLNQNPVLPYASDSFDATICTASIEYLTDPIAVLKEVARVTRTGGICCVSFSDRWFPGKEITLWSEMHLFERLGLVLDLFQQTGAFANLQTESIRGYPRPWDDAHIMERQVSDPVFAVWGQVR